MHVPTVVPTGRSRKIFFAAGATLLAAFSGGCGGSSGSGGQSGVVGDEEPKPGGGFFFVDVNQSGGASNLHLEEIRWGRLVDIHEIDQNGARVGQPVFRDMVIEPDIITNAVDYVLDRDPVTQRERLTIQRQKRGATVDPTQFDELLADARDDLPEVSRKDVDSSPPFTTVPRNACVSLRIDDCLNDGPAAVQGLLNPAGPTVKVVIDYPPSTPYAARVIFDPNHGAVVGGVFHSTRVLVDLTISEAEAAALAVPLDRNPVGLPPSSDSSSAANVAIRIPTEVELGAGQTQVLTNLAGASLDPHANQPFIDESLTLDVVRAFQSGNAGDSYNGFLTDVDRPRVIGGWLATITSATDDPAGEQGLDFLIDLTFATTCLTAPAVGDVLTIGEALLQVTEAAVLTGSDVVDLKARAVASVDAASLLGVGLYQAPFHPSLTLEAGCWVTFLPQATTFPVTGVSTSAQILARFSEPMDPASLTAFGNSQIGGFLIVDGAATGTTSNARANNIVVGNVQANSDLTVFSFVPNSALPHQAGIDNPLHVELLDAKDLAGNRLRHKIPFVDFRMEPLEPEQLNDALVLRLDANNEYSPTATDLTPIDAGTDLRGQFFYDSIRGSIIPRPVALSSWPVDRTIPLPQFMTRVISGTNNPLNPLGAKLQWLWRYCDVGWVVNDETKFNLDVIGLNWAPAGSGGIVADFFEAFEIRLGHSLFLPDEALDAAGLPLFPASGLPPSPATFEGNYLPGSNPTIVHNRALGYTMNPNAVFTSTTTLQTKMMPFPLNRGAGPDVTYTWRDTAVVTLGGGGDTMQPGIPLQREADLAVLPPGLTAGSVAGRGRIVPSFGLPLLVEIRCFPANGALGLNFMDVSLATPPPPAPPPITQPAFRAYSAGGYNTVGDRVEVQPDLEATPKGGFNAASIPPGLATATGADNVFYMGQIDTVVRVSRVHSVWLDAGQASTWLMPVMVPSPQEQPLGTEIQLDFRTATGFQGSGRDSGPYDSTRMTAYGESAQTTGGQGWTVQNQSAWSSNIASATGRRYLQVRFTFVNNLATGLSPELLAVAFPYSFTP